MKSAPTLFKQIPHPAQVDEGFHAFTSDNIANVYFWTLIFDLISSVPVDFNSIIECGVGRGRSLISISSLARIYVQTDQLAVRSDQLKIYGFDSFEGFPHPKVEDKSFRNPQKGDWSSSPSGKYQYSPEFLHTVLANASVDSSGLALVKGFFSDSIPPFIDANPGLKIGILHCDGDLYESVQAPLDLLSDFVVPGGVIVFDDFILDSNPADDAFPGARLAYQEFMTSNSHLYEVIPSPRGNVILRRLLG